MIFPLSNPLSHMNLPKALGKLLVEAHSVLEAELYSMIAHHVESYNTGGMEWMDVLDAMSELLFDRPELLKRFLSVKIFDNSPSVEQVGKQVSLRNLANCPDHLSHLRYIIKSISKHPEALLQGLNLRLEVMNSKIEDGSYDKSSDLFYKDFQDILQYLPIESKIHSLFDHLWSFYFPVVQSDSKRRRKSSASSSNIQLTSQINCKKEKKSSISIKSVSIKSNHNQFQGGLQAVTKPTASITPWKLKFKIPKLDSLKPATITTDIFYPPTPSSPILSHVKIPSNIMLSDKEIELFSFLDKAIDSRETNVIAHLHYILRSLKNHRDSKVLFYPQICGERVNLLDISKKFKSGLYTPDCPDIFKKDIDAVFRYFSLNFPQDANAMSRAHNHFEYLWNYYFPSLSSRTRKRKDVDIILKPMTA